MGALSHKEGESVGRVSFTCDGTADAHVVLGLMELPECTRTRWNKMRPKSDRRRSLERPRACPKRIVVLAKYTLFKRVFGFCRRDRAITTLPIGAEIQVLHPLRSGMVDVLWEGRPVAVFVQDLEASGTVADGPRIG
jgi:hypothetical protein